MNKELSQGVSVKMRIFLVPLLCALPLLLGSCSSSRLLDSDRVFDPGSHTIGSVIDSDIFIPEGASLHASYLAGNRIFVASGGELSGLSKGARNSTIYAESGALTPSVAKIATVHTRQVDDAREAFRNRFQNLLPAGEETSPSGAVVGGVSGPVIFGNVGFGNRRFGRGFRRGSRASRGRGRRSGAVSVRPRSFSPRN